MANRRPDLEGALLRVGQELDYPPMADISPLVRATVEREPHRRPLFRMPHLGLPVLRPPAVFRPAWQAVVAAVVAIAVLLSGVLAASPGARHAVAGWFGVGPVRIVVGPVPGTPPPG